MADVMKTYTDVNLIRQAVLLDEQIRKQGKEPAFTFEHAVRLLLDVCKPEPCIQIRDLKEFLSMYEEFEDD